MPIHESAENYLETVLILSLRMNPVRSIDVANKLGFSKPSVSVAMKNLRQEGYIEVSDNGGIELTEQGKRIAERMYERHCLVAGFLMNIGVAEETAFEDACKIEHDISSESFECLKRFCQKQAGSKSIK